ncbi:hypothetical protein RHMOL_Rhmol03G0298600 [Rhododendron molle]|uniref:Uncharacterized protein n=1 Tax=Rhododendron molle TaxID=49168 RepID=A0ACC0PJS0_RHOML|nr:hypothetical protein RHMOL_Rhmol03G0298600 [Rhododendron molle]
MNHFPPLSDIKGPLVHTNLLSNVKFTYTPPRDIVTQIYPIRSLNYCIYWFTVDMPKPP